MKSLLDLLDRAIALCRQQTDRYTAMGDRLAAERAALAGMGAAPPAAPAADSAVRPVADAPRLRFKRGELGQAVLAVMAAARGPLEMRAIGAGILAARAIPADHPGLARFYASQLPDVLSGLVRDGRLGADETVRPRLYTPPRGRRAGPEPATPAATGRPAGSKPGRGAAAGMAARRRSVAGGRDTGGAGGGGAVRGGDKGHYRSGEVSEKAGCLLPLPR